MNITFTLILTYMFEIIVDLCLMRSLVGRKWREILSKKLFLVLICGGTALIFWLNYREYKMPKF